MEGPTIGKSSCDGKEKFSMIGMVKFILCVLCRNTSNNETRWDKPEE